MREIRTSYLPVLLRVVFVPIINMIGCAEDGVDVALRIPEISFPVNKGMITDTKPMFDWAPVSGATGYELQVSDSPINFDDIAVHTVYESSYAQPTDLSITRYYWHMRAFALSNLKGEWSPVLSFFVEEYTLYLDPFWHFQRIIAPGQTASFPMGSDSGDPEEKPIHTITLSKSYDMGAYEVTNRQFVYVMNEALDKGWITASSSTVDNVSGEKQKLLNISSSYSQIGYENGTFVIEQGKEEHPAQCVTWYGAVAFAYYLNELRGCREQTYSLDDWSMDIGKLGYRLPTEAEWEFAVRGGEKATDTLYAGSNTLGDVAWYSANSSHSSHPVGEKAPNEIGLYDMSGNVPEWVWDWYQSSYCARSPSENPVGPDSPVEGTFLLHRGGGWYNSSSTDLNPYRVTHRCPCPPGQSFDLDGFRLILVTQ